MAANISTKIADDLTKHGIDLMRVDAATRRKILGMLNGLESEILMNIRKFDPSSPAHINFKTKRLGSMMVQVNADIAKVYTTINETLEQDFIKLADSEAAKVASVTNKLLTVELVSGRLNQEVLNQIAKGSLIEGRQMQAFWKNADAQMKSDIEGAMREGLLLNETIPQLTQRIRGTRANLFKDGLFQSKRYQAERIVRTSVMTVANEARGATYKQNQDVINGVQWLSTLDSRTSDICQALDGQAWDFEGNPIGATTAAWNGYPPAHINCRSTTLPVTKSWAELSNSKNKSIRKKLKEHRPPKATRASMDGQISADMNYEQWLKIKDKKNPAFAQKVLGPTKYKLWKRGQLKFKDLIDQSHNPMTVEQLLAKSKGKAAVDALKKEASAKRIASTKTIEKTAAKQTKLTTPDKTFIDAEDWYKTFADTGITEADIMAQFPDEAEKLMQLFAKRLKKRVSTDKLYLKDGAWDAARVKDVHDPIINKILNKAARKAATPAAGQKPKYVMFGGRGGSGKGSLTKSKANGGLEVIDKDKYIVLDADEIKQLMPEYKGWNAFELHEESSHIFDVITERARQYGINLVHDMTMKTTAGAVKRGTEFLKAGYDLEGYYMFLPQQTAAKRAVQRFMGRDNWAQGRLVPPQVVLENTTNEVSFDALKKYFKKWQFYDNQGTSPVLVGTGRNSPEAIALLKN